MKKMSLLLVFGGESSEHEVSIKSARNVYAALDTQKYDIGLIYISKHGRWQQVESIESLDTGVPLRLNMDSHEWNSLKPDVILPILHGPNGEDGSIQGLAQMMHVPIVGPSVVGAAVTMDKDVTKRLLSQANIPVAPGVVVRSIDDTPDFEAVCRQLQTNAVFIKPSSQGSSVGVQKVRDGESFKRAVMQAFELSAKVLIEPALNVRELEIGVMGNDQPVTTLPGEVIAGDEFYSYDAKYADSSQSHVQIPADIPTHVQNQLMEYAKHAYQVTECRVMARVDFFLTDTGEVFLNEINSIPGFTNISMFPKMWEAQGVSYPQLLDQLIDLALQNRQ